MNRRLLNFVLASFLCAVWLLGLGAMAWLSADRPQPRPAAPAAR
jgi:hypothetical protein